MYQDIINFFESIDVKLDLFYRMLWRHILILELLKLRYDFTADTSSNSSIFRNFLDWFKTHNERKAYDYFQQWGDKFWLETDEQLKQITTKLESDTKASLGLNSQIIQAGVEGLSRYSEEQITDIKRKAHQVIDGSQIANLNQILDSLNQSAFNDPQKKFYLIIDQLDEDWANTATRTVLPEPCGSVVAPRTTWSDLRGSTPRLIDTSKDSLNLVFDKSLNRVTASVISYSLSPSTFSAIRRILLLTFVIFKRPLHRYRNYALYLLWCVPLHPCRRQSDLASLASRFLLAELYLPWQP